MQGDKETAWQPDGSIHQRSPIWAHGALQSSLMPPGGFYRKSCTITFSFRTIRFSIWNWGGRGTNPALKPEGEQSCLSGAIGHQMGLRRIWNGFWKEASTVSFVCLGTRWSQWQACAQNNEQIFTAFGDMWHCLVFPRKYVSKIQSVMWCSWVSGRFLDEGTWKICGVEIAVFLEAVATKRGKMQRHVNRSATHTSLKILQS